MSETIMMLDLASLALPTILGIFGGKASTDLVKETGSEDNK